MSDVRIVLSTVPDSNRAAEIARELVEKRLAACVNVLPGLRSLYRWQGRIEDDSETLLIIKTTVLRIDELMRRLKELHPYEVPEMVVLPAEGGWPPYLEWVQAETKA